MKESAARKLDRAKRGVSPSQEQQRLCDNAQEAAKQKLQERSNISCHSM